jgi:hypothetical protein
MRPGRPPDSFADRQQARRDEHGADDEGIEIVGIALGQLLIAAGQLDQARDVLSDSLAAATKLGWTAQVQQINDLLNRPQQ